MYEKCLPCTQQNPMTPIPVYQRPTELYQESTSKRKNQGVDFNNLILLTKNSIKTRRGHSKGLAQQPFLLESKQTLRASSELRSFEEKYEHGKSASWLPNTAESLPSQQQRSSEASKSKSGVFVNKNSRYKALSTEEKNKKKRPLYRDVLANASSGAENVFEKRYFRVDLILDKLNSSWQLFDTNVS